MTRAAVSTMRSWVTCFRAWVTGMTPLYRNMLTIIFQGALAVLPFRPEEILMNFGKTTPIIRIFDEAKAREFYVGFLGFKVDFEHRFEPGLPLYMQVSRGNCVLHLSEHHGDCSPGCAMRIETDSLDAFH